MSIMIKVCPKCGHMNPFNKTCPVCHTTLVLTKYEETDDFITNKEFKAQLIQQIYKEYVFSSHEYDEEMFDKRIEHDKKIERISHSSSKTTTPNKTTCPYCNSTNVTKISTLDRAVSIGAFGLASSKIGKQWKCNNCKSNF